MKAPVHHVSRPVRLGHVDDVRTVGPTDITIEAASHLHLAPVPTEVGAIRSERSIRVILADDHLLMRRGLRLLLDGEDGVEVIAEAVDLASVVRLVHSHRPHVLVLDLSMPDGSSIETIGKLRERVPATQIVVLTMDDSPVFAQRSLAAGALGFVLKDLADSELPQAVRAAAQGEGYVSPRVAARLDALQRSLAEGKPGRLRVS
jgi:two-component system response regulator NreC